MALWKAGDDDYVQIHHARPAGVGVWFGKTIAHASRCGRAWAREGVRASVLRVIAYMGAVLAFKTGTLVGGLLHVVCVCVVRCGGRCSTRRLRRELSGVRSKFLSASCLITHGSCSGLTMLRGRAHTSSRYVVLFRSAFRGLCETSFSTFTVWPTYIIR